jgi:hypothetical protein
MARRRADQEARRARRAAEPRLAPPGVTLTGPVPEPPRPVLDPLVAAAAIVANKVPRR